MIGDRLQLLVSIQRTEGAPPANESLEVELLGANRFLLMHSPALVEGLAAGDEFELIGATPRVLRHGGNLVVWFYFAMELAQQPLAVRRVREVLESIGGRLDGGGTVTLIFTVPLESGFERIAQTMDSLVATTPGSSWMYGNVYSTLDDTPLNWWLR